MDCPQCGQHGPAGWASEPHNRPDGRRCVFVMIYRRRYLPEDVVDGDITSDDVSEQVIDCLPDADQSETPAELASEALDDVGGEPSNYPWCPGSWYSHPDGSVTVNYYTGEREEPSGHLYGFTMDEEQAVWELISAPR